MAVDVAPAPPSYPLDFDVQYPEKISRLLNLPLIVKPILAVPHLAILYALGAVAGVITIIAFFAILFTGRYPAGLFDFVVNTNRWQANVYSYLLFLRDEYPPFTWDPGAYPVRYDVQRPEKLSRWLIFVKWLLVIPNVIVLSLLVFVAMLAYIVVWFAVLFSGRVPQGLFGFIVGVGRWNYRANAYAYLLRDEYPPFSLK